MPVSHTRDQGCSVTPPAIHSWGRAVVLLGCVGLAACGYARPDPAVMPGVPNTVTSGSGGGARALGNIPNVAVTTPTAPLAPATGGTARTGTTGPGTVTGAGGSAVGAGGSTGASGTSRIGTGVR